MGVHDYGGDDSDMRTKKKIFNEFDCPECSANNPYDDGIRGGDEVRCFYCGAEFKAKIGEDGKLKLRDL